MELSELVNYVKDKYGIDEDHKWSDYPGFSVLCHPTSGRWLALLMRQWDENTGTFIEKCDMKCAYARPIRKLKSYLSLPIRMKGENWVGVSFDDNTEKSVVFSIFDSAYIVEQNGGFNIVLEPFKNNAQTVSGDTAIPFSDSRYRQQRETVPEKIQQMRRLYEYGRESSSEKAKNFYRQGKFMEDYEDDYPWEGDFTCYFPTYHDLTAKQLRGYFSWRTKIRKGIFEEIPESAAYVYVYELLNGIGAGSPEDSLKKLREFKEKYIDRGLGNERMNRNIRRWMNDIIIINGIPEETALKYIDPDGFENDKALAILKDPDGRSDEELFSALCRIGGKKEDFSPVLEKNPEKGHRMFCEIWKRCLSDYTDENGKDLFSAIFGEKTLRFWFPLSNAVYYNPDPPTESEYRTSDIHSYCCKNGEWKESVYEKLYFDLNVFKGLLHEADSALRRYFKTGSYLREKVSNAWARPFANSVIEDDRRAEIEAAKPRIEIDISGLDKIRKDAVATRDSLLSEEEKADSPEKTEEEKVLSDETPSDTPLDRVQIQILRLLLQNESPDGIIKENRLMPSMVADAINDALFDLIGDVVIEYDEKFSIVEDYREDLSRLIGGNKNE
ncbi:MAG: TerB N-terminal domain-containing protein [Clostridia bacterium]|nr:TerB N-terminal domain-containing protein [Clostridia bacterium]